MDLAVSDCVSELMSVGVVSGWKGGPCPLLPALASSASVDSVKEGWMKWSMPPCSELLIFLGGD